MVSQGCEDITDNLAWIYKEKICYQFEEILCLHSIALVDPWCARYLTNISAVEVARCTFVMKT